MEISPNEVSPRRAARRRSDPTAKRVTNMLKIEVGADELLSIAARKLKMSKLEYASAAITYFAESGLDPTANVSEGLAGLNATVLKETMQGRGQAALIGNRIMSVIRTWEKNQYTFMQEQQAKLLNYLEQMENTLHRQHTAVETNLLTPMASMLINTELEVDTLRDLSATAVMILKNVKEEEHEKYKQLGRTGARKEHVEKMREFIQTNHVAKPQPTPKPGVTPRPSVVEGSESMKTDKKQGIPLEAQVKKDEE